MPKKPEIDAEIEPVEDAPEVAEVEEVHEAAEPVEEAEVATEGETPVAAKKSIGPKEPLPFKWKLVGEASGLIVTLFKAVEREEVEAQVDRLEKEGYYAKLRILDIHEKTEQPKGAKREPVKFDAPKKSGKEASVATKKTLTAAKTSPRKTVKPTPKEAVKKPPRTSPAPPKKKVTGKSKTPPKAAVKKTRAS